MNSDIKKVEDDLNDIIQKNEDSIKGYDKAAENANEIGLQSYFKNKAKERRKFLYDLKAAVPELRTRDGIGGSVKGSIHRAWMDLKAFFSGDDDESMLEEAIRGDRAAIEDYNEALSNTMMPSGAAQLIRQQRDWLLKDLEEIKSMEDIR